MIVDRKLLFLSCVFNEARLGRVRRHHHDARVEGINLVAELLPILNEGCETVFAFMGLIKSVRQKHNRGALGLKNFDESPVAIARLAKIVARKALDRIARPTQVTKLDIPIRPLRR